MAHFYGTIKGARGEASRLGHRHTGLTTVAASWQGCVRTYLYDVNGVAYARVSLDYWHGQGTSKVIYDGPIGEYVPSTEA